MSNSSHTPDVWAQLAAPLHPSHISWRIDSKPVLKNGKYFARFVCYIEAGTVRERLDSIVPGEWDLSLEYLPSRDAVDAGTGNVDHEQDFAFKAKLRILGVIREDVGTGRDYKNASTDAFKRAAVRFGIGHELYQMEQLWVEVDGDGKYAKPVEDPQAAYDRKYGSGKQNPNPTAAVQAKGGFVTLKTRGEQMSGAESASASTTSTPQSFDPDPVSCPKCGGRMFDNRLTKRNPKAPDYKCRNRTCDGVIWPPKEPTRGNAMDANDYVREPDLHDDDELPF